MAKALTVASVEKLLPNPDRRIEIPDGLLAGLYLVVQPTGKKSWAVRYRAGRATRKLTLGAYPAIGLLAAREAAKAALLSAQKGADPAKAKRDERRDAKDRGLVDRDLYPNVGRLFVERYSKPKNRSWKETARILGLVPDASLPESSDDPKAFVVAAGSIAERWQSRRVQDIRRRDIIEVLDEMVDDDRPIAANRALSALRKMLSWAASRDILEASPAVGVKAPGVETSRDRVLSEAELRVLWKACEELAYPWGYFAQMLILSGQRRHEVAGMRTTEISGALWIIPRERAKNDIEHHVPISGSMQALLDRMPRIASRHGLLFTTTGSSSISGFSKAKTAIDAKMLEILQREAAERGDEPENVSVAPWRFHDLRRTVATGMARLGIGLPTIEKVINHMSGTFAGIVGVYQRHSFADEKRAALELWAEHVNEVVR